MKKILEGMAKGMVDEIRILLLAVVIIAISVSLGMGWLEQYTLTILAIFGVASTVVFFIGLAYDPFFHEKQFKNCIPKRI